MSTILFAFLILTILGLALSFGLFVAEKKLSVKKDEKLVELEQIMPGANCGGCGFAGCSDYANAVYSGKAEFGLCSPGGQKLADSMAKIMGKEAVTVERKVAYVFCASGCDDAVKSFDYLGISDCNAATLLFNGDRDCKYGCLHMLSCQKVCNSDAIYLDSDGNIEVDRDKCIGCGKCVSVCPHKVIKLVPYDLKYAVKCNSIDKGSFVNKACSKGCIGCKICETKFPDSGIKVENNLASTSLESNLEIVKAAAQACPKKVIKSIN